MLPGDRSAPPDNLGEEGIEDSLDLLGTLGLLFLGDHDVHMDVAIPGVTEAGDREAGLFLQFLCKGNEVDEAATGDGDVLVELGEAGGLQRCREGTAQGPDPFATLGGRGEFHLEGFVLGEECLEGLTFAEDAGLLAIDLDKQMSLTGRDEGSLRLPRDFFWSIPG